MTEAELLLDKKLYRLDFSEHTSQNDATALAKQTYERDCKYEEALHSKPEGTCGSIVFYRVKKSSVKTIIDLKARQIRSLLHKAAKDGLCCMRQDALVFRHHFKWSFLTTYFLGEGTYEDSASNIVTGMMRQKHSTDAIMLAQKLSV